MLNTNINFSALETELNRITNRLAQVPKQQTIEKKEVPDVGRSAARVLVPKTWQQYYDVEIPQNTDDDTDQYIKNLI